MDTKLIDSEYLHGSPIIFLILGLLFLVISIIMFCGKGSFLIAGYNTASKEKKERYDEKKLCRVMGCCMLVVSLLMIAMYVFINVLPECFVWIFLAVVLVDVIFTIIYANKFCNKKE